MTPLEAKAVLLCAAVLLLGGLAWGLITIWHRRRRPAPRYWIPAAVTFTPDPALQPVLTRKGKKVLGEFIRDNFASDPDDWLADDPLTWEFPEKWWPPSTLFNQRQPRPWAHG